MNRSLALLCIGLVFGTGAGFLLAASNQVTLDGHDHAADRVANGAGNDRGRTAISASSVVHAGRAQAGDAHAGGTHAGHDDILTLAGGPDAPALDISIAADPVAGWNLHVIAENFRFAPEKAGGTHVPGEGHAHVYVNGVKIARLYGPWMHIAELPAGENHFEVTLNANDHRALAAGGVALKRQAIVTAD